MLSRRAWTEVLVYLALIVAGSFLVGWSARGLFG